MRDSDIHVASELLRLASDIEAVIAHTGVHWTLVASSCQDAEGAIYDKAPLEVTDRDERPMVDAIVIKGLRRIVSDLRVRVSEHIGEAVFIGGDDE